MEKVGPVEPGRRDGRLCKIATKQEATRHGGLIKAKPPARLRDPEPPLLEHLGPGVCGSRSAGGGRLSAAPCRGSCVGAPPPE